MGLQCIQKIKKEPWPDIHRNNCIASFKGVINVGEMQCDCKMTICGRNTRIHDGKKCTQINKSCFFFLSSKSSYEWDLTNYS